MPTVEESRNLMYLQELLLVFGKKEKMRKKDTTKGTMLENGKCIFYVYIPVVTYKNVGVTF